MVVAYLGLWVALVYFIFESERENKKSVERNNAKWMNVVNSILMWSTVGVLGLNVPLHELLNAFTGFHMTA